MKPSREEHLANSGCRVVRVGRGLRARFRPDPSPVAGTLFLPIVAAHVDWSDDHFETELLVEHPASHQLLSPYDVITLNAQPVVFDGIVGGEV